MDKLIRNLLKKIENYSSKEIIVSDYCKEKMQQRNVEESLVISTLFSKSLCYAEEQLKEFQGKPEKRYKLIFPISSKYYLIIILTFNQKALKVMNVIKTSKRLDQLWKKNKC